MAMLVSEVLAATGAILIFVTCAATRATVTSRPQLLLRAIFGSVFCYSWGL